MKRIMLMLSTDKPESRSLYKMLGNIDLVQKYLLPLLLAYRDDPETVFDAGTRSTFRGALPEFVPFCFVPLELMSIPSRMA